jgi:hypothetical protein
MKRHVPIATRFACTQACANCDARREAYWANRADDWRWQRWEDPRTHESRRYCSDATAVPSGAHIEAAKGVRA